MKKENEILYARALSSDTKGKMQNAVNDSIKSLRQSFACITNAMSSAISATNIPAITSQVTVAMSKQQELMAYRIMYGQITHFSGNASCKFYKWDLALDWLKMSNDEFFKKYQFNWIPDSELTKVAKNYLLKMER